MECGRTWVFAMNACNGIQNGPRIVRDISANGSEKTGKGGNMKRFELRKMGEDAVKQADDCILSLPIVYQGSMSGLQAYIQKRGYAWKQASNLWGGYYVDGDGNCFFIT